MTVQEFDSAWEAHRDEIKRFLKRQTQRADVDDFLQETFIRLWKHGARTSVRQQLFAAAKSVILDDVRKRSRRPNVIGDCWVEESRPHYDREKFPLELIMQLSEKRRRAFILKDIRGLEDKEVAAVEGIKLNAAKGRISDARDELRELMEAA